MHVTLPRFAYDATAERGFSGVAGVRAGVIDLHTHLHPPKLFAAIRRWFAERSSWDISYQPSEPADVAAVLRAARVERFVFCSYAHKPGMARELNAWLTATSRALHGYGLPLATVHPDDPDPLGDLRAALDDGCIGLKLHEDVQRVALDDPRLAPVLGELAARGAFALVHVGPIPWHYPAGDGVERVRRALEAHPALNVVVAHYGRPDSATYFALMDAHPGLHLDTTMVFAAGSPMSEEVDPAPILAHPDRVLYGTDFPNVPYPYEREREGVERLGLPADVRAAIFGENARRLIARASRAGEA
jgi:predicted TIM-barrel fold metal-dependent hydrolase